MAERLSCVNADRARYDRRLRRKMNGYEFRDFIFTCWFAAAECRDPAFIPTRKLADLAMDLGMTGKHGQAKFAQRLEKWSSIDLVQHEKDGLQINFVIDQEDDEEEDVIAYSPGGNGYIPNGHTQNGHTQNANGSNGHNNGQNIQSKPRKAYSNHPDAVRQRDSRRLRKMQLSGTEMQDVTNPDVTENVTPIESECHGFELQSSPEMSQNAAGVVTENVTQNVTNSRDILARVSPNVNVSGVREYLNSSESGDVYVQTRAMSQKMSHPEMSQPSLENVANVAPPPSNVPPPAAPSISPTWPGGRPVLRPGFERVDLDMQQHKDMEAAVRLTGDRQPITLRFWRNLWKHCQQNNSLSCWDMALEITADEMKTAPGSVGKPGAYFQNTVRNLLRDNGVPMPEGTAEEREDVQAQIGASLLTAEMNKADGKNIDGKADGAAPALAPPKTNNPKPPERKAVINNPKITPLSDIMPEMEEG